MLKLLITVLPIALLLLANELTWGKKLRRQQVAEQARKLVHIAVGSYAALWPLWLSWVQIQFLAMAMLVVICLSRIFKLFRSLHAVKRLTYGDILYPLTIVTLAAFYQQPAIYMIAILHMSLSDGFAGLIGKRYGAQSRYRVFGSEKSVLGSLIFFMLSIMSVVGVNLIGGNPVPGTGTLIAVASGATLLENVGIYGFDNLFVPLFVAAYLTNL